MTSAFEIIPATAEDLPTLAHIAVIAMDVDLLHRVMFPSTDPLNTTFRESIILNQMRSTFAKPEAHGFKAVSKASGQIIGYGLFSFENPEKEGEKAKAPPHKLPEGINQEFMKRVGGFVRSEHAKYLADKRHVWWNHIMVLPDHQMQGIGSALFKYGFYDVGADDVPVWIVTQARGRGMYLKFGFEDTGHLDVDLAEYMGPNLGFGSHRTFCMIRKPGGVASSTSTEGGSKIEK